MKRSVSSDTDDEEETRSIVDGEHSFVSVGCDSTDSKPEPDTRSMVGSSASRSPQLGKELLVMEEEEARERANVFVERVVGRPVRFRCTWVTTDPLAEET